MSDVLERRELTWMTSACPCRQQPRVFQRRDRLGISVAREICADCPVQTECLAFALRHDEPGVWAGTTPAQRHRMRRETR